MRAKGTILPPDPPNPKAEEAKVWLKEQEAAALARSQARANRPLRNRHTYAWLYEEWQAQGGGRLPCCNRCHTQIQWDEPAHECPGFIPKFMEMDKEKREWIHAHTMAPETVGEGYNDWDDDQYDPTVPGEILVNPDEEDSGVVIEDMTEEEWLERKFGRRT